MSTFSVPNDQVNTDRHCCLNPWRANVVSSCREDYLLMRLHTMSAFSGRIDRLSVGQYLVPSKRIPKTRLLHQVNRSAQNRLQFVDHVGPFKTDHVRWCVISSGRASLPSHSSLSGHSSHLGLSWLKQYCVPTWMRPSSSSATQNTNRLPEDMRGGFAVSRQLSAHFGGCTDVCSKSRYSSVESFPESPLLPSSRVC